MEAQEIRLPRCRGLPTLTEGPFVGYCSVMDLNEIDWGTQVEPKREEAGSGVDLTLAVVRKRNLN